MAEGSGHGATRGPGLDERDPVARIIAFVSRHVPLDQGQQLLLRELTRIERYAKGTVLLAQGDIARESWLIISGCVRGFRGALGTTRTMALHTELEPVIPPTYGTDAPSPLGFECLEDVVASASTQEEEARAFASHPEFQAVCRIMGEAMLASLQHTQIEILTRSPTERYLDLVARRPDLLQRVPQYHIASFLGIEPETLSRIRRRLIRKRAPTR